MTARCKSCGAAIRWAETPNGKRMPLDAKAEKRVVLSGERARVVDTYTPHWSTCPTAEQHRRTR